jgi:predicted PurR-regulated permease PerM
VPTPEDEDKELAVLLFAGRYMFDRWFAEEADSAAPKPRFPRAWNSLTQADFERLNQEVVDKLQAFQERHEVVVDVAALSTALKQDDRTAAAKAWEFTWREGLAGIIGAVFTAALLLLLTGIFFLLNGPDLVRKIGTFIAARSA